MKPLINNRGNHGAATSARGFTLMEVMIVVVIVGILLAVALPGYQNSLQKGRRAEAKAALLDAANRQEQRMLDRGTYTANLAELGLPVPFISEEGHYTITAADCGDGLDRCYILTATPRSSSAQSKDTRCTTFTLDSTGAKNATGSDSDNCW